jgi:DNA repair protein RadA
MLFVSQKDYHFLLYLLMPIRCHYIQRKYRSAGSMVRLNISLKDQLKEAGLNSIKDIVIRGPVEVAKSAKLPLEEAPNICNSAFLLFEQLGVIPNNISEVGNNNSTSNKEYIKTGSAELDRLLSGKGVETGAITEFYGHSGSGKTQICLSLCLIVQQLNPDNKAIYINTEGKFRPERIAGIAHKKEMDADKSLMNISM